MDRYHREHNKKISDYLNSDWISYEDLYEVLELLSEYEDNHNVSAERTNLFLKTFDVNFTRFLKLKDWITGICGRKIYIYIEDVALLLKREASLNDDKLLNERFFEACNVFDLTLNDIKKLSEILCDDVELFYDKYHFYEYIKDDEIYDYFEQVRKIEDIFDDGKIQFYDEYYTYEKYLKKLEFEKFLEECVNPSGKSKKKQGKQNNKKSNKGISDQELEKIYELEKENVNYNPFDMDDSLNIKFK